MQGQFIFSTCNRAALALTALLRNTSRTGPGDTDGPAAQDLQVGLRVFHAGNLEFESPGFASIPPGGHAEVSPQTCPLLADRTREFLLLAHCRRAAGEQYFAQEHQVIYESVPEGNTTSLLYDQMPIPAAKAKASSILLLAPKIWVSARVDTFIAIANAGEWPPQQAPAVSSWRIEFLEQSGARIHTLQMDVAHNSSHVIDVKDALRGRIELTDRLRMLTVVARGNVPSCAILTFLRDRSSGALALEHSLSPHYYMNGDFARVRREAFLLPPGTGGH